ncbi:MAG: tetratricopeptide repeat protein [Bacteroides sp.]|nr:tetratricopeptide repeat protein [Bacteroides sp.]
MVLLKEIKELIANGEIEIALQDLDEYLNTDNPHKDEAYYLKGNAYRKLSNWQQALNNYQKAIDLNPESPAAEARQMVIDILNFFNKDMYNQ